MTSANVDGVYVYPGGATIDDNGVAITIGNALLAPTGSGISATGLSVSGSGYTGAPMVRITGGGGTGATAVASIDASGNLTGITMTNPGVDYASPATFTLVGGGGTATITGAPTLVQNAGGSLTKAGAGTLTLNGANTYNGTVITAGTVIAGSDTALGTGLVTLNGGGLSVSGSRTLPNNVLINGIDGNVFYTPFDFTLGGNLTGSGTVSQSGAGQLFLAGNNGGFAGTIQLTGGITHLATASAGSANATWNVGPNATLASDVLGAKELALGALAGSGRVGGNVGTGVALLMLLIGGNNANSSFSGTIADDIFDFPADPVGVTKTGTGELILSGLNTYKGATTVAAGVLEIRGSLSGSSDLKVTGGALRLGASDVLNTTASLTLAGGSLLTDGFSLGSLAAPGLGALALSATSTLDFGAGTGSQLFFDSVGAHAGGAVLAITNWSGTAFQLGGSTDDRLVFDGSDLTAFTSLYAQSDVSFNGITGYAAIPLGDQQHFEIVGIPEPSSSALLGGAAILLTLHRWRARRRFGRS